MKHFLFYLLCLALPFISKAQQDYSVRKKHFNIDASGLALQGYDAVCYKEGKPALGSATIFLFYKGVKYQFVSQAHLEQFKQNPSTYEPAYGGWCAYAMGKTGEKVPVDPTKFKIVNGQTHLFYYSIINNTLNKWNNEEVGLIKRADQNWSTTIKN